ncbi:MAG TPA: Ppx/GppA family phosphatase [Solirubrobacteraceae bacterium]|jgi:exopolyphosphatase/guanosine-5'-triphosphate,3'-diphosphate pyrophosphatase
MRVAVVDIGTNSTRLLIADVDAEGRVRELERLSRVTRLGDGVDSSGRLADASMERVFATLDEYTALIERWEAEERPAVLTSAVRDAANGAEFTDDVRTLYGLDAQTIAGSEEAQLTFLGALSDRDGEDPVPTLVIDVGGGSTELILGAGRAVSDFFSLQAGAVRQSERHLHHDPPSPAELAALGGDVGALIAGQVPERVRRAATRAIAVAGTATSCAAIDQALDAYDSSRVHGYRLSLSTLKLLLARLASLDLAERRRVRGLHPDRAATIVAGVGILIRVLEAFELDGFEASEHDILRGVALRRAGFG